MHEHATKSGQPMHLHFKQCDSFNYLASLMNLPDINFKNCPIKPEDLMLSNILNNYKILFKPKNAFL